jgi:hypothetical protein
MLNSKLVSVSKNGPAGPACTIVSKSAANFRNILTRQIQSVTNMTDRQQLIAVDAYYLAVQRGFEGGYEVDWLEAEAEIMVCNQEDFNYQSSCNN